MIITEPGIYDLPVEDYHRDPVLGGSLSSTGARKLLAPSCPALFKHDQDNPPEPKNTFDFGHAAHRMVLGAGPEIVVVTDDWGQNPNEWRTQAVKDRVAEVRAEGAIPIKAPAMEKVEAMAAALRKNPAAAALLNGAIGKAEQTLVWQDHRTGTWRRALLDFLPDHAPESGRLLVVDYKTTVSAAPEKIMKTVYDYGYHQQADWYLDGARALGLATEPQFLFIFQEKTAPYLVTVAQVDVIAMRIARERNNDAIDVYRECRESGVWPSYSDEIELIPLPAYIENQYLRETS